MSGWQVAIHECIEHCENGAAEARMSASRHEELAEPGFVIAQREVADGFDQLAQHLRSLLRKERGIEDSKMTVK